MAPALIGLTTYLTGNARLGLSPAIGLFILALFLLRWVNPDGNRDVQWSASSQLSS
jgi:UMF1 family MFS transporter